MVLVGALPFLELFLSRLTRANLMKLGRTIGCNMQTDVLCRALLQTNEVIDLLVPWLHRVDNTPTAPGRRTMANAGDKWRLLGRLLQIDLRACHMTSATERGWCISLILCCISRVRVDGDMDEIELNPMSLTCRMY